MSIKISGVLPGPTGEPAAHIGITLRAVKTSLTVITTLESNSITGADGSYSLNVEPGQYGLPWMANCYHAICFHLPSLKY